MIKVFSMNTTRQITRIIQERLSFNRENIKNCETQEGKIRARARVSEDEALLVEVQLLDDTDPEEKAIWVES
jgi:hypothetical protein